MSDLQNAKRCFDGNAVNGGQNGNTVFYGMAEEDDAVRELIGHDGIVLIVDQQKITRFVSVGGVRGKAR